MISVAMNSVLMFATVVLSDIQIEQCVYVSTDMSCSGGLVGGQCTPLCSNPSYDCSTMACSAVDNYLNQYLNANVNQCSNPMNNANDVMYTCENVNGGSDNGGSDNGGSDNGGSDNGGSDNGDDDDSHDDDVTIIISTCGSKDGSCEQCQESEFEYSGHGSFSSCEDVTKVISMTYDEFEDYGSCFSQTAGGITLNDMNFTCSGGAAASSSDNTGMIVGIVIGCIILVAGIVTFVFCMKKQNKL